MFVLVLLILPLLTYVQYVLISTLCVPLMSLEALFYFVCVQFWPCSHLDKTPGLLGSLHLAWTSQGWLVETLIVYCSTSSRLQQYVHMFMQACVQTGFFLADCFSIPCWYYLMGIFVGLLCLAICKTHFAGYNSQFEIWSFIYMHACMHTSW